MKNYWKVTAYILICFAAATLVLTGFATIKDSNRAYEKSLEIVSLKITNQQPCYNCIKDGYAQALLYFSTALSLILLAIVLPRLSTLSFGPNGLNVTLKDIQSQVTDLKTQTTILQETTIGTGGSKIKQTDGGALNQAKQEDGSVEYEDDPQKGKWGGLASTNGRVILAKVRKSQSKADLFEVTLTVTNTIDGPPLKGLVKFHLHDTFLNPDPVIAVEKNKAVLKLNFVYGAFTVGAEMDDGYKTRLELDLASLKDAPKEFLEN